MADQSQSHIEDMRAAVRGDLERARARNPSIFEAVGVEVMEEVEPEPASEPSPPPVSEPTPVMSAQPVQEPEPALEPSPVPAARSFWSRLFRS